MAVVTMLSSGSVVAESLPGSESSQFSSFSTISIQLHTCALHDLAVLDQKSPFLVLLGAPAIFTSHMIFSGFWSGVTVGECEVDDGPGIASKVLGCGAARRSN